MEIIKKILPHSGSSTNVCIDHSSVIDTENDLYSTSIGNSINEENIIYPGTSIAGGGNLQITNFQLQSLDDGQDSIDMRFYLVDGANYPDLLSTIKVTETGYTEFYMGDVPKVWSEYNNLSWNQDWHEYYMFIRDMFVV